MCEFFKNLVELEILYIYLAGLATIFFRVIIIFTKQEYKRSIERERLKNLPNDEHNPVGDVESKINDSYEFKKVNFWNEFALLSIQPLFLLVFLNLYTTSNWLSISAAFGLLSFMIVHEFYGAITYSDSKWYKFIICLVWISCLLMSSFATKF